MKLRIKELREDMHLTQKELADKIGNSQRNVSHWESGLHEPDCETLVKLADTLYVSLDELFGRVEGFDFSTSADDEISAIIKQIYKLSKEQKNALSSFLSTVTK